MKKRSLTIRLMQRQANLLKKLQVSAVYTLEQLLNLSIHLNVRVEQYSACIDKLFG